MLLWQTVKSHARVLRRYIMILILMLVVVLLLRRFVHQGCLRASLSCCCQQNLDLTLFHLVVDEMMVLLTFGRDRHAVDLMN